MQYTTYDIETYPNYFCMVVDKRAPGIDEPGIFEISERRNDCALLPGFIASCNRLVGFNNEFFDYPVIHYLFQAVMSGEAQQLGTTELINRIYEISQAIINTPFGSRNQYVVWGRDRKAVQVDLMRIHHLDNRARHTSLKALQIAMRSPSVEDLPFPPGTVLTYAQMDEVAHYCLHDVMETARFLAHSAEEVAFREELGPSWLCLSDASLGKRTLRQAIEKRAPGLTDLRTPRDMIALQDIILPYIEFREPAFNEVLDKFRDAVIPATQIKKSFPNLIALFRGMTYHFGVGGIHGSMSKRVIKANDEYEIADIDVRSFYPSLAIVNRLAPAHLGEVFCEAYAELFAERIQHPKGSPRNKALKLALNAVFGDSNSVHSRGFYDPAFMLSITVNGQLLLAVLAEALAAVEGVTIIQVNTDGITLLLPRARRNDIKAITEWWERATALTLEHVSYQAMWIRDVNNYIAQDITGGEVKRKGAYEYKYQWWQDPSMPVVARAAEAHMVYGQDIGEFLRAADPWDFLIRARVRGRDRLAWCDWKRSKDLGITHKGTYTNVEEDRHLQKNNRYYVATQGRQMVKIMPPLAGKAEERHTIQAGGKPVVLCNVYDGSPLVNVDYDWYEKQVKKLIL